MTDPAILSILQDVATALVRMYPDLATTEPIGTGPTDPEWQAWLRRGLTRLPHYRDGHVEMLADDIPAATTCDAIHPTACTLCWQTEGCRKRMAKT